MIKIETLEDNIWYPTDRNFRHVCCDCNLSHDVTFKIVNNKIYFKWKRNNRYTSILRRYEKTKRKTIYN